MTQRNGGDGVRRVLLTGVFDMQNYGDLLFPLIAAWRLERLGVAVTPVSPTGAATGVQGAMTGIGVPAMLAGEVEADAILLGGGYIIHNRRMDFLEEYQAGDMPEWTGPSLWLGATLAGAARDVPVLWNAPGVPHPFAGAHRRMIDAALRASDYVSLRDRGALELLAPPFDLDATVVPDPIADLARMWPRHTLEAHFARFMQRKALEPGRGLLALHLRRRSLADLGQAGIAALIDGFAQSSGLHPLLVAVGRSHEDDVLAREVSGLMRSAHTVLDDPESLMEIAAAIAHSRLYVGASLHGYVTAAAYGVPAVQVAKPAYRKFAGFLEHTGRLDDLARDWTRAFDLAAHRLAAPAPEMLPQGVFGKLDAHWERIGQAIGRSEPKRAARLRFLRDWLSHGVALHGPGWATLPFQSLATARPLSSAGSVAKVRSS